MPGEQERFADHFEFLIAKKVEPVFSHRVIRLRYKLRRDRQRAQRTKKPVNPVHPVKIFCINLCSSVAL
jgi:hypothetical protein